MIDVLNLTKSSNGKKIVNSVTFSVSKGEIVGLVGPNGSGKTTICDMIAGFSAYNDGSIKICDNELMETENKGKVGYMPQFSGLYEDMTVKEYLTFVSKLKKTHFSINESFELDEYYYSLIANLPSNIKKKVLLAQALIGNPEVLVLDEPTLGVDKESKECIIRIIKEVSENTAVLIATTDELEIFDRVVSLNNENLIEELAELDEIDDVLEELTNEALAYENEENVEDCE